MAGGTIFEKTIDNSYQNGSDKCLIIEPNYAYQVPFTFGSDWEEITLGMFVSYVATGASNENVGLAPAWHRAGGTTVETYNYIGLVTSSAENKLPTEANQSGYLGMRADKMYLVSNTTNYFNKLLSTSIVGDNNRLGKCEFLATNQSTILESKEFDETNGNVNILGLTDDNSFYGDSEGTTQYMSYWQFNYKVLNKGQSNQLIRVTAASPDTNNNNISHNNHDDPSLDNLKNFINGVNPTYKYDGSYNMHGTVTTTGFVWNDGANAYTPPDSLFYYNAFQNERPRIHSWAVKKIS
jgi:hypothetical protein